jgi:bifunctional ADP-heptose synthase (sugar kinase/adenylyltransferase)
VANNLKSLGAGQVSVLAVVGDDGHAYDLLRALSQRHIGTDLIVREPSVPTFTYSKLINRQTGVEDLPRGDFVFADDLPQGADEAICWRLRDFAHHFDAICVSDQAETKHGGIITAAVRAELASIAQKGALVWVDSRRRIDLFRNAVLKVNEEEAQQALARTRLTTIEELRRHTEARVVFVTQGGSGVTVTQSSKQVLIPTKRLANPVDICGAGDSFTAGAASAMAAGATPEDAARLGHLVASVTIMKKGTGCASPEELTQAEQAFSQ